MPLHCLRDPIGSMITLGFLFCAFAPRPTTRLFENVYISIACLLSHDKKPTYDRVHRFDDRIVDVQVGVLRYPAYKEVPFVLVKRGQRTFGLYPFIRTIKLSCVSPSIEPRRGTQYTYFELPVGHAPCKHVSLAIIELPSATAIPMSILPKPKVIRACSHLSPGLVPSTFLSHCSVGSNSPPYMLTATGLSSSFRTLPVNSYIPVRGSSRRTVVKWGSHSGV